MTGSTATPDFMPTLSPGRHRNARKGACFMEFASYLAGERWSDHPACTHPVLATLARDVNDLVSDAGRANLTSLIPRVVGLTSDDPGTGIRIALRAARAALPVASMERQRVLAVVLLSFEPTLGPESRAAFEQSPALESWARGYLAASRVAPTSARDTSESIVHTAVTGIAFACVDDTDARLVALLTETIEALEGERPRAEDYFGVSSTMSSMSHTPASFTR